MRKRILTPELQAPTLHEMHWLDLSTLATAEFTSEDAQYPIEAAFGRDVATGWRAASAGRQIIRLLFDVPLAIKHIQLLFVEAQQERTQEIVLRYLAVGEQIAQEIVRQQYNFSPPHAGQELEDYTINLTQVQVLELEIVPDIKGGNAHATLAHLRVA